MAKKGNNEGSVYKDKQGKWRGAVTLYTADGKPKRKYFYGKTKREVTEKVNQVLNELRTNTYIEPSKVTLYSWLCTWLDTYCRNNVRPTTLINYETYIHRHIQSTIGNVKLCDLNVLILQQFYNDRLRNGNLKSTGSSLSAKTLRNMHNMIHKALNQAVFLEMIPKNPADYVTIPKIVKQERKFFTVEEQQELQKHLPSERIGMAVMLDLYTGMRMGELLGLPWRNVHIDPNGSSYIRVTQTLNRIKSDDPNSPTRTYLAICQPKTANAVRTIPLLPNVAEALENYRAQQTAFLKDNQLPPTEYVFTSTTGSWIDPRDFQRDFKQLLKRHHIREINVHGIRHTFATRALESGMSIKTLSKILGHADSGFTMDTYAHVTEDLMNNEMTNLQGFLNV